MTYSCFDIRSATLCFSQTDSVAVVRKVRRGKDLGGLHIDIEMAALKTVGDCMEGSVWAEALVQAQIVSAGIADLLQKALHVMCTKMAHQVTVAALYILQHCAYDHSSHTFSPDTPLNFDSWCDERKQCCPQFQYWAIAMK